MTAAATPIAPAALTKPMPFSGPEILRLLDGTKEQARRVIKPQPELIFRLTDSIEIIHNTHENKLWRDVEINPSVPEFRLHGGRRWEDLFQDPIRRSWSEGLRGLVSISRVRGKQGLFKYFHVPPEQEAYPLGFAVGVHGFSRPARSIGFADEAPGREQIKQRADELNVGDTARSVVGREETRDIARGRASSAEEAYRCRTGAFVLGVENGALQSEVCERKTVGFPRLYHHDCPFRAGDRAWVKETYRTIHDPGTCREGALDIDYRADGTERIMDRFKTPGLVKWKSGRFMPKWASRITLEIVAVRVERLNSISAEDAIAEGIPQTWGEWGPNPPAWAEKSIGPKFGSPGTHLWDNRTSRENFALLWDEINGPGAWAKNEVVFVYRFRRIKP